MNTLERHIQQNNLDPVEVMNLLQSEGGIISDECVMPEDVAEENAVQAVEWLKSLSSVHAPQKSLSSVKRDL